MHELSLCMSLVEQLEQIAAQEKATKVVRVELVIGALSGVERDALEFAFPMAVDGTIAEEAELRIEEVPVRVRCTVCGAESEPELPMMLCGECQATAVEVVDGRDFLLKSLEVS